MIPRYWHDLKMAPTISTYIFKKKLFQQFIRYKTIFLSVLGIGIRRFEGRKLWLLIKYAITDDDNNISNFSFASVWY